MIRAAVTAHILVLAMCASLMRYQLLDLGIHTAISHEPPHVFGAPPQPWWTPAEVERLRDVELVADSVLNALAGLVPAGLLALAFDFASGRRGRLGAGEKLWLVQGAFWIGETILFSLDRAGIYLPGLLASPLLVMYLLVQLAIAVGAAVYLAACRTRAGMPVIVRPWTDLVGALVSLGYPLIRAVIACAFPDPWEPML
jgi:hypothetical protein